MVEESCFDGLDRSFLNLSSRMSDFFSWTYGTLGYRLVAPLDPGKFDNATSKAKEIGIRAVIFLGAITGLWFAGTYLIGAAVVLGAGSKLFRKIGFAFQKEGFTHIRGKAPEKSLADAQASVMTWNIRGHGGGLHYSHGVVHWSSRIDRIVEQIQKEDPDVVVLQEVYDTALVEELVRRLGDRYAHFFTHLGANTWGEESGCMVITKCAVHHFSHHDFTNNDWEANRGFDLLQLKADPKDTSPSVRIMTTQLAPGKEAQKRRMEQATQIIQKLAKEKTAVSTLFVGSLNADRDRSEEGKFISKYLYNSYLEKDPTQSDQLGAQWNPKIGGGEESSDFISLFKRCVFEGKALPVVERDVRLIDCHVVRGFDESYNTKAALSDHHAIVTTFRGLRGLSQSP